jgi:hypothetical protein
MRSSLAAFLTFTVALLAAALALQWLFTRTPFAPPMGEVALAWALAVFGASTVFVARIFSELPAFSVLAPVLASFFRIFLVAGGAVLAVFRFPDSAPLFCAVLGFGIVLSHAADFVLFARQMRQTQHGR